MLGLAIIFVGLARQSGWRSRSSPSRAPRTSSARSSGEHPALGDARTGCGTPRGNRARTGRGAPKLGNLEAGIVASLTSMRTSIVSGGVLTVVGTAVLADRTPAFARYDAQARSRMKLDRDFFARSVHEVAPDSIGVSLLVDGVGGPIVEVEATDHEDPAAHGYGGRTRTPRCSGRRPLLRLPLLRRPLVPQPVRAGRIRERCADPSARLLRRLGSRAIYSRRSAGSSRDASSARAPPRVLIALETLAPRQ